MSTRADADAVLAAEQVQAYAYGWLVWWSLRYRRFEAWDCRDAACFRAVYADSAAELWDRMQQVELGLWRTPSPGATPLVAIAADHLSPSESCSQADERS
ncbi:hypothetical protein [Streptosporangium sp. NPDC049644]|uniref:hypothetical protein n=1 Tax=Streptosporangium sp. NPDC049644 TaxID=3155507 RepID=UPI0034217FEA